MKKTKLFLIFSVIALFTTSIALLNVQPTGLSTETISDEPMVFRGSTITIDDNGDFAIYSSTGNGLPLTPYVIENLVLDGNGSDILYIENTDAHFIFRNCILFNGSLAIKAYNVTNGIILNNTITNCSNIGIELDECGSFQVENNSVTYMASNSGFSISGGIQYLELVNNTFSHNGYDGAYLWGINHSIITKNTMINNTGKGLTFDDGCNNNTIAYNTLNNNLDGLYLTDDCNFNRIQFNTMNNNTDYGINIYDRWSLYNVVMNNTANFNEYAGIYSDEGRHNTFINNTANANQVYGINLASSALNYTFIGNEVSFNLDCGMYLENANNSLTYNRANNNTNHGINLNWAANSTLTLNTANGNGVYGVYLDTCTNCTVTWNVLHEDATSVIQSGGSGNVVVNNSAVAATLTSPAFLPAAGETSTTFNFSVVYTDIDNLAPFSIRVFIDGIPYDMVKQNSGDNTYNDGCTYVHLTTLAQGPHIVSFEVFDITHKVTTVQTAGPSVTAPAPIPGFDLLMLLIPLLGLTLTYFIIKKQRLSWNF